MIWITTFILISESIDRLKDPKEINGKVMVTVAIIGVFANLVMFKILGGHGHGHSHHSETKCNS